MNKKTLKTLFLVPLFLVSCGEDHRDIIDKTNRYKDFASMKEDFDKGVKNNFEKECVATVFNLKEDKMLSNLTDTYYIYGFRFNDDKTDGFDEICQNINPDQAYVFLLGENFDIFVSFKAKNAITSYSSIKLEDAPGKYSKDYADCDKYKNLLKGDASNIGEGKAYPGEFLKFRYSETMIDTNFDNRFKLLTCGEEGTVFANILFSSRTSIENTVKYSSIIKDYIVSQTSK